MLRQTMIAAALSATLAGGSEAAVFTIEATSTDPALSDFTFLYNDIDGDSLLTIGIDDILDFSGFFSTTMVSANDPVPLFYGNINLSPAIPNVSGATFNGNTIWNARNDTPPNDGRNDPFSPDNWTYEVTQAPLPAPALLLLAGLGALGLARRFRRA